jgi:hypothetical protein
MCVVLLQFASAGNVYDADWLFFFSFLLASSLSVQLRDNGMAAPICVTGTSEEEKIT